MGNQNVVPAVTLMLPLLDADHDGIGTDPLKVAANGTATLENVPTPRRSRTSPGCFWRWFRARSRGSTRAPSST